MPACPARVRNLCLLPRISAGVSQAQRISKAWLPGLCAACQTIPSNDLRQVPKHPTSNIWHLAFTGIAWHSWHSWHCLAFLALPGILGILWHCLAFLAFLALPGILGIAWHSWHCLAFLALPGILGIAWHSWHCLAFAVSPLLEECPISGTF